jgi:hypothetical protein
MYERTIRLSPKKQNRLPEHFVAGATGRTASAIIGVQSNTVIRFCMRLKVPIASELPSYEFNDEFEADKRVISEEFGKGSEAGGHPAKWPNAACSSGVGRSSLPLYPTRGRRLCCRSSKRRSFQTALFTPTRSRLTMLFDVTDCHQ